MPLPDERPRATVANLIGRFEQQNKRHSLSAASNASPSRSSSVVSNITGDSAKEEVKEKREWPPKSAAIPDSSSPLAPPAPIYGSAFWSRPKTAAAADSPSNITSEIGKTSTNVSSSPTDRPEPNVPAEPPSSPTPQPQAVAPAVQSPRATKTAARTTVKHAATPRSSMTPINLQHTGQSMTSTSSPKPKVVPSTPKSSRSSGVPTTPSSIRPKTPGSVAAGRPKTPAIHANRPKTPSSTTPASRPKTPSSGLFAPTAASLARARTGPPQPPAPTRKVTLSSAAAERLSKPTAASLSKARSAPPVTQVRGTPSTRGGTNAAKGGVKSKTAATTTFAKKAAPASTTDQFSARKSPHHGNGEVSHEEKEVRDASAEEIQHTEEPAETNQDDPHDGAEAHEEKMHEDDVEIHVEELREEGDPIVESEAQSEAKPLEESSPSEHGSASQSGPSPAPSTHHLDESSPDYDTSSAGGEAETLSVGNASDIPPPSQEEGNDIEDMVNLLEFVKPRPISMANIPDELDVHEIPDEE